MDYPADRITEMCQCMWVGRGFLGVGFHMTRGGGGWVGGGGGVGFPIYGIVRMCVPNGPLFQRCQVDSSKW